VTEIVTVGWLTMDDIVLPDGSYERQVLGGGALYSAVGAQIWNDRVGLHSVTGQNFADRVRTRIAERGLATEGINAIPGNGLELWLLHENETDKQQVPKLSSATAADMNVGFAPLPDAYSDARGFHVAPQSPAGSFAHLLTLSDLRLKPVITLDIRSDAYVDARLCEDLSFLHRATAFLPSLAEIERIWRPRDLEIWLRSQATSYRCHMAAKLADEGSLVCEAGGDRIHRVPAFPARVLDTTGAGDAYAAGFLAALSRGRTLAQCGRLGSIAAAAVIGQYGARPQGGDLRALAAALG
jgi:sugar/nucleoside kinase (ribokinase family)